MRNKGLEAGVYAAGLGLVLVACQDRGGTDPQATIDALQADLGAKETEIALMRTSPGATVAPMVATPTTAELLPTLTPPLAATEVGFFGAQYFLLGAINEANGWAGAEFATEALNRVLGITPAVAEDFADATTAAARFATAEGRIEGGQLIVETPAKSYVSDKTEFLRGEYGSVVAQCDLQLAGLDSSDPSYGLIRLYNNTLIMFAIHRAGGEGWEVSAYDFANRDHDSFQFGGLDSEPGGWHNLIAIVSGENIAFFVDGKLVFVGSDARVSRGQIGLSAGLGTQASFDNLRVWSLGQ